MRARKIGRKVENACVSYTYVEDDAYELLSKENNTPVGRVRKAGNSFQASVGGRNRTFRTMAEVIVWASNLIYDGEID